MRKKRLSRNVGVLLDETTYQQLVKATDEKEITMSKFIREVVVEKLTSEAKGVQDHERKYQQHD
jgi:hypothetical protein